MLDIFIDTILDEQPAAHETEHAETKKHAHHKEPSIEEQAMSAVELAQSVYTLHGNPNPIQMIKLLSSLDNQFLSAGTMESADKQIIEDLLGMLL